MQNVLKDVEEERERELVKVIDKIKLLKDEENGTARLGDGQVFGRDLLYFSHDRFCFFDFTRNFGSFHLERLKSVDYLVVVQDITGRFVQCLQEKFLQSPQTQSKLALNLHEVRPLALCIRPFDLKDLVQGLALQATTSHREVDERYSTTDVRGEFY